MRSSGLSRQCYGRPPPEIGVIVQRTITEVIVHARAIAVWRVELTRPREQHTGATVPYRHCTASRRHPCGVLRVSLCAACPLEARPCVRVLSVAFSPTTPSCLVQTAHGPAAVLHCDLSGLRGNYEFSCTHAHSTRAPLSGRPLLQKVARLSICQPTDAQTRAGAQSLPQAVGHDMYRVLHTDFSCDHTKFCSLRGASVNDQGTYRT
jgi:hypothetical protein